MKMIFKNVPIGAKFIFHGKEFTALALSCAENGNHNAQVFGYEYGVECEVMGDAIRAGEWIKGEPLKNKMMPDIF